MILNILFSLMWLRIIRYIRHDYQETGSKVLLVAESVTALILFAISVLWVRSTL